MVGEDQLSRIHPFPDIDAGPDMVELLDIIVESDVDDAVRILETIFPERKAIVPADLFVNFAQFSKFQALIQCVDEFPEAEDPSGRVIS